MADPSQVSLAPQAPVMGGVQPPAYNDVAGQPGAQAPYYYGQPQPGTYSDPKQPGMMYSNPGQPGYSGPPQQYGVVQQPQQQMASQSAVSVVVAQPTVVGGRACPHCHQGFVREELNVGMVVLTIVCFFFIGLFALLCLLCVHRRVCSVCGREA